MSDTELSLSDIQALMKSVCDGNWVAYHFADSHEDRLVALENILEFCYNSLADDRQLNKNFREDALTVQIVRQLQLMRVEATHDTRRGGHCDILVVARDHFLWIAEAKIHRDFQWLKEGFEQLSIRYGCDFPFNHANCIPAISVACVGT